MEIIIIMSYKIFIIQRVIGLGTRRKSNCFIIINKYLASIFYVQNIWVPTGDAEKLKVVILAFKRLAVT